MTEQLALSIWSLVLWMTLVLLFLGALAADRHSDARVAFGVAMFVTAVAAVITSANLIAALLPGAS